MIKDYQFCQFLDALAADVKRKNGLILTEWESSFLASYVGLPTNAFHFTEARRKAVDRMWRRYGVELNHPHPLDDACPVKRPEADPAGCQFLLHDESRRQVPCNEPAVKQRQNGFRYCETHSDQVEREMKRLGKSIHLVTFAAASPGPRAAGATA